MPYLYILITQSHLSEARATSFKHLERCIMLRACMPHPYLQLKGLHIITILSMPFSYTNKAVKDWIIIGKQRPELKHAVNP